MLNCTISRREVEYQNLMDFTEKIHQEIVDIVSTLGWSIETIKSDVRVHGYSVPVYKYKINFSFVSLDW